LLNAFRVPAVTGSLEPVIFRQYRVVNPIPLDVGWLANHPSLSASRRQLPGGVPGAYVSQFTANNFGNQMNESHPFVLWSSSQVHGKI
jgi:hypothetical protein